MKNTMITIFGQSHFYFSSFRAFTPCLMVCILMFVSCLFGIGVNAQTQINPGNAGYVLIESNGTSYEVAAGLQINNPSTATPSAAINDTSGNSVSWTIRNFGVVGYLTSTNAGSPYNGIYLYSTGTSTIINEASGSIISGNVTGASRAGVNFSNGWGILDNKGYIYGAAHGVIIGYNAAAQGGQMTNSGTIISNASGRHGISVVNGRGEIRNTGGLIKSNGGNAVDLAATVVSGSIWNTGGGIMLGASYGVNTDGGGFIENNASLVQGDSSGMRFVGGTGVIRNIFGGTILGIAGHGINTGAVTVAVENNVSTIEGRAGSGLRFAGNLSSLKNSAGGKIIGTNYGVTVEGAANVLLENDASEIRGGNHGVSFNATGSFGTVRNINGSIISGSNSGINASAVITVENSLGSWIRGQGTASTHAGINLNDGGVVMNSGTISNVDSNIAVYFSGTAATATGTLSLDTGSVLEGDVLSAKAEGNHIALNGSGIEDSHFTGTSADTGFESLSMNGSQWWLSGSIAITGSGAAALAVNSGTLSLDGSLAMHNVGGISIGAGGLLDLNLAGDIMLDGVISGAGSLTHAGAGLLTLTATNTYTGQTTIATSGTIKGSIGSSALHLGATDATYIVADGTERATLANITGNGIVNIQDADLVFDVVDPSVTQTYDFQGTLNTNGGNKLIKSGSGTLELTRSLSAALDGGTAIENGTLKLDDNTFINITGGVVLGAGDTAGLIEYGGVAPWDINVTLAGAGGGFSVASGTQTLAITVGGSGAFVKGGAGALDIRNTTFSADVNATEVGGGELIGNKDKIRGDITMSNNATVVYEHAGAAFSDTRAISGDGNLIKTGAGLLTLTGSTTYTGDTTVREGTLQGNIGSGALTVEEGATYKVADNVEDFSLAGILGGGNVDLNAASLVLDVAAGDTGVFSFSGSLISANPASKLVKTGAGTTDLQSAVTLQGGAEIREGTLRLANQNFIQSPIVLGTGSTSGLIEYTGNTAWAHDVTLASGGGGGFSVAGGTQTLTNSFAIKGAGSFVKGGAGTLDIAAANIENITSGSVVVLDGTLRGDTTKFKTGGIDVAAGSSVIEFHQNTEGSYAGIISGSGSLLKTGSGSLTLTATNTYGDTIIRNGLLSGNIGQGMLTIESSGTYKVATGVSSFSIAGVQGNGTIDMGSANLEVNVASGTSVFNFLGNLAGGNQFIKTGSGTLELLSTVALAGGAAVEEGVLRLDNAAFLLAPVVIGTGSTTALIEYTGTASWGHATNIQGLGGGFRVNSGTVMINGAITYGAGSVFIKDGAGVLDISGATGTGSGTASVQAGTLRGRAANLPATGIVVANGAVVEFYETSAASYAGIVDGAGAFAKTGTGTLTISGSLAHTGVTFINGGALKLTMADMLATTSLVSIGVSGALDANGSSQTIGNLVNNGAIYLDATVNSRAGVIQQYNTLTVTGSAIGSGTILVRLAENASVTTGNASAVIVTTASTNNYTATIAERAVYGPYEWAVAKDGNTFVLTPGVLSPEVSAVGGIDASSYLVGKAAIASLGQRLMAARSSNPEGRPFQLWAGGMRREDTLKSDLYDGAEARTDGIQIGADWNSSKASERPLTFGVYYDYASSEMDMPQKLSSSKTKSYGLGIYGSYRTKPLYVDVILRNARDEYEVTVPYTGSFKTDGYSVAASVEVGGVVTNNTPWNVEPQLQIVYQRHTIEDIVDGVGRPITVNSADSIEGRLGLRVWREFASADREFAFIPYLRPSLMYETNGRSTITFLPTAELNKTVTFDNKYGGSLGMIDGGFSFEWKGGFRIQAEGAWYYGDKLQGYSVNVAAAFVW